MAQLQPEPENFLGYNPEGFRGCSHHYSPKDGTPKDLLSGGAFAVLVVICLALGALALLT